ncbi:MAG: Flp pilus assembly complex ATPase component TadA, partial [Fibrella sp.]|nr:Flp pilus assembly complex ATPase component TadA [Armatimonadota bacterium]
MADQFLTRAQQHSLETLRELDFNYFAEPSHVFRASFFHDRGTIAMAFRLLSKPIPTFASLDIPSVVENLCRLTSGLILVTGASSSGQNELVAAMIDRINSSGSRHILTFEDQIEYFHTSILSVVQQREIGLNR